MNHFILQIAGPKLRAAVAQGIEHAADSHLHNITQVERQQWNKAFASAMMYPLTPDECLKKLFELRAERSVVQKRLYDSLGISAARLGHVRIFKSNQHFIGPILPDWNYIERETKPHTYEHREHRTSCTRAEQSLLLLYWR